MFLPRRTLLRYALTAVTTRTATEAAAPALLLATTATGRSPSTAALLVSALSVSAAAIGPVAGTVLDSVRRPVWVFAVAMALLATSFSALAALPSSTAPAVLIGVVLVGSLGQPVLTGGWSAQLTRSVPSEHHPTAFAVDAASYNLGGLLGPALAALLLAFGPRAPYVGVAALVLAPLLLLPFVPLAPAVRESGRARVTDGLRVLVRVPRLRANTVVSTIGLAGQASFVVAAPALSLRLTGGLAFAGTFLVAYAVGGLAGTALQGVRPLPRPGRTVFLGTVAVGVALGVVALGAATGQAWLALAGIALAGLSDGVLTPAMFVVRGRESPDHTRGQVFTIAASLRSTGYAAAAAALAPIASHPEATLLVGIGIQVVAVVAGLLSGPWRRPGRATTAPRGPAPA